MKPMRPKGHLHAMLRHLVFLVMIAGLVCGCASVESSHLSDVRSSLLASARRSDPDFPDGRDVLLTHFSHVGQLVSSKGEVVYVADRRAVLAGMLAPRG